jgi:ring-1,2-phenylacetyl-CoA epoxidase subunit PaaE
MKLEILSTSRPTPDSISLYFSKSSEFDKYKAGQYALLSFKINGEVIKRSYSFHTSPLMDRHVGITVREVNNGVVSTYLQNFNGNLEINLEEITGDFYLEPDPEIKRHLIMFAGGSGITPIMSMVCTVLHSEPRSSVSLVYSNKDYSRIIFKEELHELEREFGDRLKVYHVITKDENVPADFPVFYKGRLSKLVTKKLIKGILFERNDSIEYYLCGPYPFMQLVEETIRSMNPNRLRIFKEHFFIPDLHQDFDPSTAPTREIIIQTKEEERLLVVQSGKSILQAALENNIHLSHSCTEGQCGRCRAFLISGQVKLRKNHVLTDDELKEGQILLCQGFPMSEGVTVKSSL